MRTQRFVTRKTVRRRRDEIKIPFKELLENNEAIYDQ